jgi:hypothetical protein
MQTNFRTMSVYRRRTAIVAAATLVVLAAFLATLVIDRLGARIDPFQVAWLTLSIEIVAAIYKWGVGGWSRYTPPDPSHLSSAGAADGASGAAPSDPQP